MSSLWAFLFGPKAGSTAVQLLCSSFQDVDQCFRDWRAAGLVDISPAAPKTRVRWSLAHRYRHCSGWLM